MLCFSQPTLMSPFKNLRSLILCNVSAKALPYVQVIFSPSITHIRVTRCEKDVRGALLALLASHCPNLHQVDISGLPREASTLLCHFKQLQNVMVSTFHMDSCELSAAALDHLARLPTLRAISMSLPGRAQADILAKSEVFPALTTLELCGITDDACLSRFLTDSVPENLRRLVLRFPHGHSHSSTSMSNILDTISKFSSLQELQLSGVEFDGADNNSLQHLLRLRSLESLRFGIGAGNLSVTNQQIPTFGQAWPKLTELSIESGGEVEDGSPQLTLEALGLFALHCPMLRRLTIDLDATVPPAPDAPYSRSLEPITLSLEDSVINERCWPDVAAYITGVYPNASVSDWRLSDDEDMGDERYWADVARMVPVLAKARRDELARAGIAPR